MAIDGHRLAALMIQSGVGVPGRRVFELHRIDADFSFDDEQSTRQGLPMTPAARQRAPD